jgi:hypothetical protein
MATAYLTIGDLDFTLIAGENSKWDIVAYMKNTPIQFRGCILQNLLPSATPEKLMEYIKTAFRTHNAKIAFTDSSRNVVRLTVKYGMLCNKYLVYIMELNNYNGNTNRWLLDGQTHK